MKNHIRNQYTQQEIEFHGKIYNTYTDIYNEYKPNIRLSNFFGRLKRGYSIEEALDLVKRNFIEYKGIKYDSYKDLHDNVTPRPSVEYITFLSRKNKGWSIDDALYMENDRINHISYNNHVYKNLRDLYDNEYHTTSYNIFTRLYKKNYSIEDALLGNSRHKKQNLDCFGKAYSSVTEKCKAYKIRRSVYENRLKSSYPEMAALGILPIISRGNGRSCNNNIVFRSYFHIKTFQYIGVDNEEYWLCVINKQKIILSKKEIYKRMEAIVIEERNNGTFKLPNQTTEKSGD